MILEAIMHIFVINKKIKTIWSPVCECERVSIGYLLRSISKFNNKNLKEFVGPTYLKIK